MAKKIIAAVLILSASAVALAALSDRETPASVQISCHDYADQRAKRGTPEWLDAYEECVCIVQECM